MPRPLKAEIGVRFPYEERHSIKDLIRYPRERRRRWTSVWTSGA